MTHRLLLVSLVLGITMSPAVAWADHHESAVTKYLRFQVGEREAYGILQGDRVLELGGDLFGAWWKTENVHALKDVKLLVPSKPSKVFALAGNYKSHLGEQEIPENPEPFIKLPSCLIAQGENVVQPKDHEPVHFEAEVVIVIGKRAKNVSREDAMDYVLGLTCGNDISARVWQQGDRQWWRAKASDTFGPCGPYIAAGLKHDNLEMTLRLNGQVRQQTNTKMMVHDIPTTVSFISQHTTLEPGDLIYTGTPGKTHGMQPGDVMTVEIEGVGVLRNKVVAAE